MKIGTVIKLEGKTQHGRERITRYGPLFQIIGIQEKPLRYKVYSLTKHYHRWITIGIEDKHCRIIEYDTETHLPEKEI